MKSKNFKIIKNYYFNILLNKKILLKKQFLSGKKKLDITPYHSFK